MLKKWLWILSCWVSICMGNCALLAQQVLPPYMAAAEKQLTAIQQQIPQEKLYFLTDRTLYEPGETIWLAAFLTDEQFKMSQLSLGVWVELIQPNGSILHKFKIKNTQQQILSAYLDLPKDIAGGIYTIRLQSDWMFNFGQKVEKRITVQKVLLPRLLFRLELEREHYGAGSEVTATLQIRTQQDKPLPRQSFLYEASIGGEPIATDSLLTDANGNALIRFRLPASLRSDAGVLSVKVPYEGAIESTSAGIPLEFHAVDLQFLPEGGDWVANTPQRIAFKALNHYGKPTDISGEILDAQGNVVQRFTSYHQGMGSVVLAGSAGEAFTARITEPTGINTVFELPYPTIRPATLHLQHHRPHQLEWVIHNKTDQKLHLVGVAQNKIILHRPIPAQSGVHTIVTPTDSFPMGIAQFTVFDDNQQPLAERLVFVNKHRALSLTLTTNQTHYAPFDLVRVSLQAKDDQGKPVTGSFAVAVVDDNTHTFINDKQDNILSGLLLTADLKGVVHEPEFYFDPQETKADTALDLVLLTQGWRRFVWEEVLHSDEKARAQHISFRPWDRYLAGSVYKNYYNYRHLRDANIFIAKEKDHTYLPNSGKLDFSTCSKLGKTDKNGHFSYQISAKESEPYFIQARYRGFKTEWKQVYELIEKHPDTLIRQHLNSSISGTVLHSQHKQPVAYASVELWKNHLRVGSTQSDFSGNFKFDLLPAGVYTVRCLSKNRSSQTDSTLVLPSRSHHSVSLVVSEIVPLLSAKDGVRLLESETRPFPSNGDALADANTCDGSSLVALVGGVGAYNYVWQPLERQFAERTSANDVYVDGVRNVGSINMSSAGIQAASYRSIGVIEGSDREVINAFSIEGAGWVSSYHSIYLMLDNNNTTNNWYQPTRTFYRPSYSKYSSNLTQTDYRKTLYWDTQVSTDTIGQGYCSFLLPEVVGTYRIIAEGISKKGQLGRQEKTFSVQVPFDVEVKIPPTVSFGDTVVVAVLVRNTSDLPISGFLGYTPPPALRLLPQYPAPPPPTTFVPTLTDSIGPDLEVVTVLGNYPLDLASGMAYSQYITVPADSFLWISLPFQVGNTQGQYNIDFKFSHKGFLRQVKSPVEVVPQGFPHHFALSGNDHRKRGTLQLDAPIEGSLSMSFLAVPDILTEMMQGLETIIREPSGCFEQVSSSNYPNILALQYLKENNTLDPAIREKALSYLHTGYNKLVGYETSVGGFEWFGHTPPHEGLTAYGLMQFHDMRAVFDGVDNKMVERTTKWLLDRRDGKGGWKKEERSLHAWGNGSLVDAYLVWALAEIGQANIILPEIAQATQTAIQSENLYQMALVLLANQQAGQREAVHTLAGAIRTMLGKEWNKSTALKTITSSYGISAQVETAALCALALMRMPDANIAEISPLITFIAEQRGRYGFGSCQGTVLALKSFIAYTNFTRSPKEAGDIEITINDTIIRHHYSEADRGLIRLEGLERHLHLGNNAVSVQFLHCEKPIQYSLQAKWNSLQPDPTAAQCVVRLDTRWARHQAKVGDMVHLSVRVENTTDQAQPSALAQIGIPSGLSLQPWQLKDLTDKKLCDYYEIRDNRLVLYYSGLAPKASFDLGLDLKADVAGSYRPPAHAAYLYYTPENRHWQLSPAIHIE